MMRILNFGSLNIDDVYSVEHFVRPGETVSPISYQQFPGGKGLNQSVALACAGAKVCHAGLVAIRRPVSRKNCLPRAGFARTT